MSNQNNTQVLEDSQQDFDQFLAQRNWAKCHAIVDSLGEQGFEHESMLLHQSLNRAKALDNAEDPNEKRDYADEAAGHEDPRDVADRTNSGL